MNERSLRVLEFHKILTLLKNETETPIGNELAHRVKPLTDIVSIQLLQDETDEAVQIIRLNKTIPLTGIFNITDSLKRSEIGSTLSTTECVEVAHTIHGGRQARNFIDSMEEEIPLLKEIAEQITPLRELEMNITLKIDENGHVVDSASDNLKSIRSTIRTSESRIRERLNQLTKSKSKMLSESIVTIRNIRYVLPVKSEYRNAIGGIVHDQSASGQTLFMEPKAIIDLNNKLQQSIVKEKQEIEKILQDLTLKIAEYSSELLTNLDVLANVDFIFARGKLGQKMKASMPKLNNKGILDLKQVRHPLIPIDEVVASDISLGASYHAIVITGPNTGGKTVTLKTVGLCTLMAQSGLQIPALDGCEIAVFDKVFADIGDEQSIEQNLSTFSSHMTNIVDIMEQVDEHSLVLFDELGAGTDPQEGAALAMALLDEVISRNARVVATTHYPELKAYGYNRENVMNASVEFDVETLRPTYRLLMGVPGRSNAFEISQRLGLRKNIIDEAKGFIGIDTKNVENMITALEDTKKQAEKELEDANQIIRESEAIRVDLEKEWKAFHDRRDQLYKKAEEKAEKSLRQAREEAEIIVAEVRHMKDNTLWKEHEWIEAKKLLDEAQPKLTRETAVNANKVKTDDQELVVGDEIKHKTFDQSGHILEKLNKSDYLIQIGMMKINAKRRDLIFMKKGNDQTEENAYESTSIIRTDQSIKTELDLRGNRYEDAMLSLEQYIDDVLVQGYARVTIIHGKGTGALRKGVEKFIQQHPHITSHRLGALNEGGSGVTIIELN